MASYQIWNLAICNHFFSEVRRGQRVVLTTDSESLRQCMQEQRGEDDFDSESDAVIDFVDAVLHEYRQRSCRWRMLEETSVGEIPDYLAFLAAEVLAAINVGDLDQNVEDAGDSFWRSFQDLFGEAATPSPQFYGDQVEVWNDLAQWANVRNGRRNGYFLIPEIERRQGSRWFVNLPYSQCLLRITDLDRLTGLFAEFGLRPDDSRDRPRVTRLVQSYLNDSRWFTRHAQRVLRSRDRWTDAFDQIVEYLRDWDGNVRSAGLRANHSIRKTEISVDKHLRTSRLDFRLFDTEKEDATGRLTSDQVNKLFGIGVFQRLSLNGLKYRPRAKHYLLAVEHAAINRFLTVNRVRPGEQFRLIVHLNNRRQWQKAIYQVCEDDSVHIYCSSQRQEHGIDGFLSGLPTDWILMEGRCRSELSNVPEPWRSILDERSPRICAVGGLKLTRNEWQAEAGPRILVSGPTLPSKLLIDAVEVSIPPSGFVTHSLLDSPGLHVVSIDNRERRCRGLRVYVRESNLSPPLNERSGWTTENAGWPFVTVATHDANSNSVVGMSVGGAWGNRVESEADTSSGLFDSAQRSMIRLLLSNRPNSRTDKTESMHPLVKLIASTRVLGASKCKPGTRANRG